MVGSVNGDVTFEVERLPRPGETVVGSGHYVTPGGKGANQAVAAARLGAKATLIGMVGEDNDGTRLLDGLEAEGIDTNAVTRIGTRTGTAFITVDSDAENTIVVSPGANADLSPERLEAHSAILSGAKVVLAQFEVPLETVLRSAQLTTGLFILNPAPALPVPADLLERVDILIVNRSELAVLTGSDEPGDIESAAKLAQTLSKQTVVTLGSDGAILVDPEGWIHHAAVVVDAVDPTGAGDTFCGAIAAQLSRGVSLADSIPFAVAAGALAVTKVGAQAAMPERDQVEALVGR